jgi:hypothetical protein
MGDGRSSYRRPDRFPRETVVNDGYREAAIGGMLAPIARSKDR